MIIENRRAPVIPPPQSCGVILSYRCMAQCLHCMYGCSPSWKDPWMTEDQMDNLFGLLSAYIQPSPYGPESISLNHGLHLSGGEPFLDYPRLLRAVELTSQYKIPSVFVETNCFWCRDDAVTREKFLELQAAGMKGVMISVNPFYLEFVPFENTERAIRIAYEIFGDNLAVYQMEYYRRFLELGITGMLTYQEYLQIENEEDFMRNLEFFLTGRPVYALSEVLDKYFPRYPAENLINQPCRPDFIRPWHNHFDNHGNYMPGYCGGLSYGNWENLDSLVGSSPDPKQMPILSQIMVNDFFGLLKMAGESGYKHVQGGYFSKCHLCVDIRRFFSRNGNYAEVSPREYYTHLD